jgi:hypothetical protein
MGDDLGRKSSKPHSTGSEKELGAMSDDKVRVDFSYYRDCNGALRERRRVEGKVIYDEPVLAWHGEKPWVEISLADWPWE